MYKKEPVLDITNLSNVLIQWWNKQAHHKTAEMSE